MTEPTPTMERDERGLIKGFPYPFRADGSIDWRRVIPNEFLVIQREYEEALVKRFGMPANEIDRALIDDRQLLILLGGIKRLLFLRGYHALNQRVDHTSAERCVCTCSIDFAANYETDMEIVTYSDVASASYANTSGDIPQMFLEATAANRALVRCVRGFLNINIAGKDEIGPSVRRTGVGKPEGVTAPPAANQEAPAEATTTFGFEPKDRLAKRCQEMGLTFDLLKLGAANYKGELKTKPEEWASINDVPSLDAYVILGKIAKKEEAVRGRVKA